MFLLDSVVFKRGQKKLKESAAQTYAPNVKTVSVSQSINLLRLYKKWKKYSLHEILART